MHTRGAGFSSICRLFFLSDRRQIFGGKPHGGPEKKGEKLGESPYGAGGVRELKPKTTDLEIGYARRAANRPRTRLGGLKKIPQRFACRCEKERGEERTVKYDRPGPRFIGLTGTSERARRAARSSITRGRGRLSIRPAARRRDEARKNIKLVKIYIYIYINLSPSEGKRDE